jgi:hypothetical protein
MHEHFPHHGQDRREPSTAGAPPSVSARERDLQRRLADIADEAAGAAAEGRQFAHVQMSARVRTAAYDMLEHSVHAGQETVAADLHGAVRAWNRLMQDVVSARRLGIEPGSRERRLEIYRRIHELTAQCGMAVSIALEQE